MLNFLSVQSSFLKVSDIEISYRIYLFLVFWVTKFLPFFMELS